MVGARRPVGERQEHVREGPFPPGEVLSSDAFRAMVRDDENDQSATADAFDALKYVARKASPWGASR